ncbi:hypothetical protein [uncultured Kordia sp.]|uniref:hypothetical protein n=1 Tax=uncultured Kordia sp. TaxID=507699 RepID=UPI0026191C96|nr:hypothetical protein [uncultured Kordia sp.]
MTNILSNTMVDSVATVLQEHQHAATSETFSQGELFGLLELPFLIIALVFCFLTAKRLRGGKFGRGMNLIAWGFLVMAIGHLHMQVDHLYGYNLFNELLGHAIGKIVWFTALIATWGLSALGFYKIYKASKI